MQEPLQTKWEVHSDSVIAIKAEDAGLSLHKLPEAESMGKYTEAHNINNACVLCMCVRVQGILLGTIIAIVVQPQCRVILGS